MARIISPVPSGSSVESALPTAGQTIGFLEMILQAHWVAQCFMLSFLAFIGYLVFMLASKWMDKKKVNGNGNGGSGKESKTMDEATVALKKACTQIQIYNQDFPKLNGELERFGNSMSMMNDKVTSLNDGQKIFHDRISRVKDELLEKVEASSRDFIEFKESWYKWQIDEANRRK